MCDNIIHLAPFRPSPVSAPHSQPLLVLQRGEAGGGGRGKQSQREVAPGRGVLDDPRGLIRRQPGLCSTVTQVLLGAFLKIPWHEHDVTH